MKKLICILLSALTLFAFTACEFKVKKDEIATTEEIEDYLEDVDSFAGMLDDSFGATFTYTKKWEENEFDALDKGEIKISGKISVSDGTVESVQYKATENSSETAYSQGGKLKYTYKCTEEVIALDLDESEPVYYVKYKTNEKSPFVSEKSEEKVKTSNAYYTDYDNYVPTVTWISGIIASALGVGYYDSYVVYIDGDNFEAISLSSRQKTTVTVMADGDEIEAMRVVIESYGSEEVWEIKIKDSVEIKKPSNSRDYENIDD